MRGWAVAASVAVAFSARGAVLEVKVVGPDGAPIPGALVIADRSDGRAPATPSPEYQLGRTGPDGRLTLSGVAPGSWGIGLRLSPADVLVPPRRSQMVVVKSGDEVVSAVLACERGDRVRVFRGDSELVERRLRLGFIAEDGEEAWAITDGESPGQVVLRPGSWRLESRSAHARGVPSIELDGVALRAGEPLVTRGEGRTLDLIWRFVDGGRVEGQVSFEGGRPALPSDVSFMRILEKTKWSFRLDPGERRTVRIDADGRFGASLPPGAWRVGFGSSPEGEFVPAKLDVDVAMGETVTLAVRFLASQAPSTAPTSTVHVEVRTPDGNPVAGAQVVAFDTDRRRAVGLRGIADPIGPGGFELRLPSPGVYRVEATHPDWADASTRVEIAAESEAPTRVSLTFRPGAAVLLRRVGDASAPPPEVLALPSGDQPAIPGLPTLRPSVRLDGEGLALLRGLAPGRWRLEARSDRQHAAWSHALREPGQTATSQLELDLTAGTTRTIEVVPELGAAILVALECRDGSAVLGEVTLRARSADAGATGPWIERVDTGPPRLDAPRVFGSIPPGRWRVELQRSGAGPPIHLRGTGDPDDPGVVVLGAREQPHDLGNVFVDCSVGPPR